MQKNTPGKGVSKGKIRKERRIKKKKRKHTRGGVGSWLSRKKEKKRLKERRNREPFLVLSFHHQDIPWREQSELEKLLPPCSRPPRFFEDWDTSSSKRGQQSRIPSRRNQKAQAGHPLSWSTNSIPRRDKPRWNLLPSLGFNQKGTWRERHHPCMLSKLQRDPCTSHQSRPSLRYFHSTQPQETTQDPAIAHLSPSGHWVTTGKMDLVGKGSARTHGQHPPSLMEKPLENHPRGLTMHGHH